MRQLVATPKFKKAYKKFIARDYKLEKKIKNVLKQMREEVIILLDIDTHDQVY